MGLKSRFEMDYSWSTFDVIRKLVLELSSIATIHAASPCSVLTVGITNRFFSSDLRDLAGVYC